MKFNSEDILKIKEDEHQWNTIQLAMAVEGRRREQTNRMKLNDLEGNVKKITTITDMDKQNWKEKGIPNLELEREGRKNDGAFLLQYLADVVASGGRQS